MNNFGHRLVVLSLAATLAAVSSAQAAEESGGLQEIVVTAQKRSQTAQDVAISMGVLSAQDLKDMGIQSVRDVAQYMPNVSFNAYFEAGRPDIVIRGVTIGQVFSANSVAPVGYYNDDVFVGARSGQTSQMFDVERVEVLRGPQGTLFGRNTDGGAINVIQKKPSDKFEADGSITYGRFNELDVTGGVSMPISDTLSIRVAGIKRDRDGWVTNTYPNAAPIQRHLDNIDNWGARVMVLWKPNEDMNWLLNVHGAGNDSRSPAVFQDLGSTGANEPNIFTGYQSSGAWNQLSVDSPSRENLNAHGAALTGNIRFGAVTLTSISAYDYVSYLDTYDIDGSPFTISQDHEGDVTNSFSQELRLAAKTGPVDWVGGVYYYHDHLSVPSLDGLSFTDPTLAPFGFASITFEPLVQTSYNYAAFADARWALTDTLTLDIGGRYTRESKSARFSETQIFPLVSPTPELTCAVTNQQSWAAPTGRIALEFKPERQLLTYMSYSRGFKSGGFSDDCTLASYDPETVDAFEIGEKGTWFDDRLIANLALFYNKVRKTQALTVAPEPGHPNVLSFFERNAASSSIKGGELEIHMRPVRNLTASLSIGVADAQYGSFEYAPGLQLGFREVPFVPQKTLDANVQYAFPLADGSSISPQLNVTYKSHVWFDAHELPGIDEQDGYALVDGSIPWRSADGRYEVALWGKNLTDKHYYYETLGWTGISYWGAGVSWHGDPRTYGVRLSFHYE